MCIDFNKDRSSQIESITNKDAFPIFIFFFLEMELLYTKMQETDFDEDRGCKGVFRNINV